MDLRQLPEWVRVGAFVRVTMPDYYLVGRIISLTEAGIELLTYREIGAIESRRAQPPIPIFFFWHACRSVTPHEPSDEEREAVKDS